MFVVLILLSAVVGVVDASTVALKAKVGEPATLFLGGEAEEWHRVLKDGTEQHIKKCTGSMEPPACNTWLNSAGDAVGSGAIVKENGDLYIKSVKHEDAGNYQSPQIKGRTGTLPGGGTYGTAAPLLTLFVED
ncbi:hypothetical protein AB6A40_009292 [Gnathostoma spinigerum]|uniref:Uncharacterized protein n=1 Tax=Gnathostoma spinigerum TaxID=75299 RepID=A0ABD6ERL5_9BILA